MKKSLNIILIILSVLILCLFSVNLIINEFIIPKKIQPLLINYIQSWTGKEPNIERISFSFLRGLRIENISIFTPFLPNFPIRFSQIDLKFSYLPLIFKKEFIYGLRTTPIEKLNISLESYGFYSLVDKTLASKIFIYDLSLSLIKYIFPVLPLETIEGLCNPEINLEIASEGTIKMEVNSPIEKFHLRLYKQDISGTFTFSAKFKKLKEKPLEIIETNFIPQNINILFMPINQSINLSQGKIVFKEGTLNLDNLKITYLNELYEVFGKIESMFNHPKAEFKIKNKRINLEAKGSLSDKVLAIEKISLNLPHSDFKINGKIKDFKTGEIYLEGKLDTQDLEILPLRLPKFNLTSLLEIEAQATGELRNINMLNSLVKVKTKSLAIERFRLENLDIRIKTERGKLDAELKSDAYGGDLVIDIKDFILKDNFPFTANLIIEDLDLKKLNELSLRLERNLEGIFNGEFNCQGEMKKIRRISGEGWFEITNGLLWELPVLSKLNKFIEIPGIEKSVFKEAHANFIVKDEKINTEDLELLSKSIILRTKGSISFNGNLDLKLSMEIPKEVETSGILEQIQDILLKGAGKIIKEIQIKGTIKNPEYKIIPSVENIFQNILP